MIFIISFFCVQIAIIFSTLSLISEQSHLPILKLDKFRPEPTAPLSGAIITDLNCDRRL
jgi:hypothetical protein